MTCIKALAAKAVDKSAVVAGTVTGGALYLIEPLKTFATPPAASGLVDWEDAADAVKAEMSPGISAAILVGVIILGIAVAWSLFKRFSRG